MNIFGLTAYILVWPVLSAGILVLLIVGLLRDIIRARKEGSEML